MKGGGREREGGRGEAGKEGGERKGEREEGREGERKVWGEEIKDVGEWCISLYLHHTNEGYRERRKLKGWLAAYCSVSCVVCLVFVHECTCTYVYIHMYIRKCSMFVRTYMYIRIYVHT